MELVEFEKNGTTDFRLISHILKTRLGLQTTIGKSTESIQSINFPAKEIPNGCIKHEALRNLIMYEERLHPGTAKNDSLMEKARSLHKQEQPSLLKKLKLKKASKLFILFDLITFEKGKESLLKTETFSKEWFDNVVQSKEKYFAYQRERNEKELSLLERLDQKDETFLLTLLDDKTSKPARQYVTHMNIDEEGLEEETKRLTEVLGIEKIKKQLHEARIPREKIIKDFLTHLAKELYKLPKSHAQLAKTLIGVKNYSLGLCTTKSILVATLCDQLGIEYRVVQQYITPNDRGGHVLLEVSTGKEWWRIDSENEEIYQKGVRAERNIGDFKHYEKDGLYYLEYTYPREKSTEILISYLHGGHITGVKKLQKFKELILTIQYDEKDILSICNLGDIYQDIGEEYFEQAILCYKEAQKICPLYYRAYKGLGEIYEKKGDLKKAQGNYSFAVMSYPSNRELHENCYRINKLLNETKKSDGNLEQLFKLSYYFDQQNAIDYYTRLLEVAGQVSFAHNFKKWATYYLGQIKEIENDITLTRKHVKSLAAIVVTIFVKYMQHSQESKENDQEAHEILKKLITDVSELEIFFKEKY